MSSSTPSRITDSKWSAAFGSLMYVTFILLMTAATDGRWHSLFLPSLSFCLVAILFISAFLYGTRIPRLNTLSWFTLGTSVFFLLRAWFSPDKFDRLTDMSLVLTACSFYVFGFLAGVSDRDDKWFFRAIAFCLTGGAMVLAAQYMLHSPFTLFRPSWNFSLVRIGNVGFFGYKNFMGHLLVAGGMFCWANALFRTSGRWKWLIVGLTSIIAAFGCGSRAVYPNLVLGTVLLWILLLCKVRNRNSTFYATLMAGVLAILFSAAFAMITLSNNGSLLKSLSTFWADGSRFQMSEIAVDLARQAPLFGHGSLSFEYEAIPHFVHLASPNLAHNEYAQCMSDYGFTGLFLLVALILVHLVVAFRSIIKTGERSPVLTARIAGSICVVSVAAMHASMEFIWHSGAIVAMGACCAGIISAGSLQARKAGKKINNTVLAVIALCILIFYACIAVYSHPVWRNEWKISSLPPGDSEGKLNIVKETAAITNDPRIINAYASRIAYLQSSQVIFPESELEFTESALRRALEASPNNHYTKTYLGIILNLEGKFKEADRYLRPFVDTPGLFYNGIFPWRAVYVNHLSEWIDRIGNDDPATALSLINEAESFLPLPYVWGKPRKTHEFKEKFELQKMMLEAGGAQPDDSWKNRTE